MKESIESVYSYYFHDVYYYLLSLCRNHHTAEDLVQETFLRAYLHVDAGRSGSIKSWLYATAYHAYIDYYRKQKRSEIKNESFFAKLFSRSHSPEDEVVLLDELRHLFDMLNGLPENQKHAILLHDVHQLSYKEAADVMNVSLANFKVILHRGRQAIRKKRRLTDD